MRPRAGGRPRTRGATAPTDGSARWPSRRPAEPSGRTTSESTKPTNGVAQAASPELRAAAGPPAHRVAHQARPAGGADRADGRRRDGAVVDDHDRTLRTRPSDRVQAARELLGAVAHRDHDRQLAVDGTDGGCGVRIPASSSRRARRRWPAPSPTGDGTRQRETTRAPLSVSVMSRSGVPPASRRPPARIRVDGPITTRSAAGAGHGAASDADRALTGRAPPAGSSPESGSGPRRGRPAGLAPRRPTRAGHRRGRRWATRPSPPGRAARA